MEYTFGEWHFYVGENNEINGLLRNVDGIVRIEIQSATKEPITREYFEKAVLDFLKYEKPFAIGEPFKI